MSEAVFRAKSPWIMALLMDDFGLGLWDAAAVMGNLGHESGGLTNFQEDRPTVPGSAGGLGWAQWTGPRRRSYEAYAQRNNLHPHSDQANYGWLWVELSGSESAAIPATKAQVQLDDKVKAFEANFERAGVKHYSSRMTWARRALEAYNAAEKPIVLPEWARPAVVPPPPVPVPPAPPVEPPFHPPVVIPKSPDLISADEVREVMGRLAETIAQKHTELEKARQEQERAGQAVRMHELALGEAREAFEKFQESLKALLAAWE